MPEKLLVIDDQRSMTKVVGHIAAGLGFEVKAVTDPAQATEVFLEFVPDVVVLDLVMPEVDGIEVLNEILATGVRVPIIVMTDCDVGYLRLAEGVAKFHESDQVSILIKPFRCGDLVRLLQKLPTAIGWGVSGLARSAMSVA